MSNSVAVTLDKIVSLCKRRGFVYPSADIYGGLNGVYDFGPLGLMLKENICNAWKKAISTQKNKEVLFIDGAILGPHTMWLASGHVDNFSDPMVDCLNCKHRFRADEIDLNKACSNCGIKNWTEVRQFNMMFQTQLGATADQASIAYLRPETAQAIYVNFKNVYSTCRTKMPFGIAQIGKAFRNEITPRQFLFRVREFEQMEMEWFCKPTESDAFFDFWYNTRFNFYKTIGIKQENLRMHEHGKDELAHYSKRCIDVEYQFPFGWKELEGIAHRGDYDLSQHMKFSHKDLSIFDEETKESYIPHIVETSVGVGRAFLMALCDAYCEDVVEDESRVVLKLHPRIAPIKACFMPLSKKLSDPIHAVYASLKEKGYSVDFDESGSIGKRYRRNDEIGTPLCFTYDFESEQDQCVTVRHRDTTEQQRININSIEQFIIDTLNKDTF